ncbi:MAG TPA: helix-turn-helix transcriptional regulator [Solirubrobacterales bacterium]
MSSDIRLTPTSYIVLGMLGIAGESTPYELKQGVAISLGNFWSLQHAQLYSEPERLAAAGYVTERREKVGRRRRHYRITAKGRRALADWVAETTDDLPELRDPALLKVFFGADPGPLATRQLAAHRAKLEEYESILELGEHLLEGPRITLEGGIAHEKQWLRFWSRLEE